MRKIFVCPSLLAADKNNMLNEIKLAESLGCKYIHIDIMDGKFVPNFSFGVDFVKTYSKSHKMINDVHIMIVNPKEMAKDFLEAGADILTFHLEACSSTKEVNEIIDLIHSYNKLAGLSISPNTDVKELLPFIDKLDLVLIMSVEPGSGGQQFMESSLGKIRVCREYIDSHNLKTLIEVDGGIKASNIQLVKDAGVDIVVSGSYLFGHEDIKERYELLIK